VDSHEKRFLNAAGLIGYAPDLEQMINSDGDTGNAQLFFTKIFLDETSRVRRELVNERSNDVVYRQNGPSFSINVPTFSSI
jgi:hypothetical protein